jgi:hypothetical protein
MVLALFFACANACQDLCQTMANYATGDCDLKVTDKELEACAAKYEDASESELQHCADWNDEDQLKEWWSCEELAENYENGTK